MSRSGDGSVGAEGWFAARAAMGVVLGLLVGLFPLAPLVVGGAIPAALGMPGALGAAAAVLVEGLPAALAALGSDRAIGPLMLVRLISDAGVPIAVALLRRRGWGVSRAVRVVGAIGVGATSSVLLISLLPLTGAVESALAAVEGGGRSPVSPPGAGSPWDSVGLAAAAVVVALMWGEVIAIPILLVASLLRLQGEAASMAEEISRRVGLVPDARLPPNPHRERTQFNRSQATSFPLL